MLIIGGLSTIVDSFGQIIIELSKDFPVYFIETRDRPSSRLSPGAKFDIGSMGQDIVQIIKSLGLADRQFALMGYSFGACIIAECYSLLESKPECMIFMEPTPVFHYPPWSLLVIRWLGKTFFKVLRPLAKWYLTHFFINTDEDREMALITSNSLDNADPLKLRNTILAIASYKAWNRLGLITCPSLVVGTSKDRLHIPEDIDRMVSYLNGCKYIDMETNLRTHSSEMGQVIRSFINSSGDNQ